MTEPIQVGLIITAIGMGLVFAGIILLWGLMALIVQIGAGFEENPVLVVDVPAETNKVNSKNKQAAVAALAVAMALKERSKVFTATQPATRDSSWLQINRARAIQEKSLLLSSRQNRRS
jgi:Na+-transporting methylmalonyl-CoA/oxaloacetate decarboxylase gamma subunit